MGTLTLKWKTICPNSAACHMARTVYPGGYTHPYHGHDFAEIYWIESGELLQRNQHEELSLAAGDMVIIAPGFSHELQNAGTRKTIIVNIAFQPDILQILRKISPQLEKWFLPPVNSYRKLHATQEQLEPLARQATSLLLPEVDNIELVEFLLHIIRNIRNSAQMFHGLSPWLNEVISKAQQPNVMAEGVQGLVKTSRRSRQHLARVLKQEVGFSPTELIAQIRMRYAASQLRLTQKDVLTICNECGLKNPTHFYRLFKQTFGQTPNQYRKHL